MASTQSSQAAIRLHLAPMEGLVDPLVREFWSALGGFELCTTEFIRVTNQLLPDHVFERYCPELRTRSRTACGLPVAAQLLGGDPACVADNAARLVELGAYAIDLNFGCPAPTVNRHDGGAVLLQQPERIHRITEATRKTVPVGVDVTTKLRLGFMDTERCLDNVLAAAAAGSRRLTIHCRTKADFYRPPAYWEWVPRIRDHVRSQGYSPEIFANGEIWTYEDFLRCQEITNADGYMLGRGAIADPYLALKIQGRVACHSWSDIERLMLPYFDLCETRHSSKYAVSRMKQWLKLLSQTWSEARVLFDEIKVITDPVQMRRRWSEGRTEVCQLIG